MQDRNQTFGGYNRKCDKITCFTHFPVKNKLYSRCRLFYVLHYFQKPGPKHNGLNRFQKIIFLSQKNQF